MKPATPDAICKWPTLVFKDADGTKLLFARVLAKRLRDGASSMGSPRTVPVPCASTKPIVRGSTPERASAVADDVCHALLAGSQIANLARAVVIHRRAFDDREDVVTVGDRFVEPLE